MHVCLHKGERLWWFRQSQYMLAHSFGGAHMGRVYVCAFIGVSVCMLWALAMTLSISIYAGPFFRESSWGRVCMCSKGWIYAHCERHVFVLYFCFLKRKEILVLYCLYYVLTMLLPLRENICWNCPTMQSKYGEYPHQSYEKLNYLYYLKNEICFQPPWFAHPLLPLAIRYCISDRLLWSNTRVRMVY